MRCRMKRPRIYWWCRGMQRTIICYERSFVTGFVAVVHRTLLFCAIADSKIVSPNFIRDLLSISTSFRKSVNNSCWVSITCTRCTVWFNQKKLLLEGVWHCAIGIVGSSIRKLITADVQNWFYFFRYSSFYRFHQFLRFYLVKSSSIFFCIVWCYKAVVWASLNHTKYVIALSFPRPLIDLMERN